MQEPRTGSVNAVDPDRDENIEYLENEMAAEIGIVPLEIGGRIYDCLPLGQLPGEEVMEVMTYPMDKRGPYILAFLKTALPNDDARERLAMLSFSDLNKVIYNWIEKSSDGTPDD